MAGVPFSGTARFSASVRPRALGPGQGAGVYQIGEV